MVPSDGELKDRVDQVLEALSSRHPAECAKFLYAFKGSAEYILKSGEPVLTIVNNEERRFLTGKLLVVLLRHCRNKCLISCFVFSKTPIA